MTSVARVVAVGDRHLPNILRWVNDPELRLKTGTIRPVNEVEHRDYFGRVLKDPTRLFLAIEDCTSSQHVGMVGLNEIDLVGRNAELWIYIGEEAFRGKGHAREAFEQVAVIGFESLGLHRISASVFEFNQRAQRFFLARGMKIEGRRREAVFKMGRYWDVICLALLADEFRLRCGNKDVTESPGVPRTAEQVLDANKEFHSRLADGFLEIQPYGSPENRNRVRQILERIAEQTRHGRLLDVGCGSGFILDLAHDLFGEIHGIDPTEAMIRKVVPRPNVRVQIGLVESLPFPDASFDAVTAYGVLHHLFDLEPAFREIRRVLRPGGVFYADESPSYDFGAAMRALPEDGLQSDVLRQERSAVLEDAARYEKRFGIPRSVVNAAMFQGKAKGGLRSQEIADALRRLGFTSVRIVPRWFAGQAVFRRVHGDEAASLVSDYLSSMLPLSAPFFKYLMIEAVVDT